GSTEQNSGDQTGRGGELEIAWDAMRNLRLSGNYAYQHATDNQTGTDAGYAPRRHAFGMADWRFCRNWQAGLTINWVADRARTYGDNRPQTP
ncbi:hypothetical protein ACE400_29240, partial [Salmonella enterica]|uniref:hypothetical protein n=1 Tax=Salmonella enterica TaxID=28901 RepID=UPI003D2774C6